MNTLIFSQMLERTNCFFVAYLINVSSNIFFAVFNTAVYFVQSLILKINTEYLWNVFKNCIVFCLFVYRFLIDNRCNVAAVNNEGEIPLDLAEEEDMEEFLQEVIEKKGKDQLWVPLG